MTCYTLHNPDGTHTGTILCGDLGPACHYCGDVSTLLCDFPIGDAKGSTCDRAMCDRCASPESPAVPRLSARQAYVKVRDETGLSSIDQVVEAMKSPTERTETLDWCAEHAAAGPAMEQHVAPPPTGGCMRWGICDLPAGPDPEDA